jgi:L-ascorbate metabolism protein UlaG (beta-lactamase superfamily)
MRPGKARVRYLGHATVLIELHGLRVLTDPVLGNRIAHLRRRAGLVGWSGPGGLHTAAPVQGIPPVAPVDVVLISHAHHDHLDLNSLRAIGRHVPMVVPAGAGRWLTRRGFQRVHELRPGEGITIGDLRVVATPARHSGFRAPFGPRAGCLGFIVEGPQRIYFAGDTELFAEMAALRPVDLALLPVWGWGRRPGAGHLDPACAVDALRLIRPAVAVPIHWGTLHPIGFGRWTAVPHARSPLDFAELAHSVVPEVDIRVLEPGEALDLPLDDAPPGQPEGSLRYSSMEGGAPAALASGAINEAAQEDSPWQDN